MRKHDQTTKSKRIRSFMQEMQHAFADWVKQLPFIKSESAREPERGDQEEKSADQTSAPHPTDGALAGKSHDKQP